MKRIGDDVRGELRRFGPASGMTEVLAVWPAAVGDAIARYAWPARLGPDGTLHVSTDSSAWAFELTQLAPTILARLREALPEASPTAVRFRPGRLPEPPLPDRSEAVAAPVVPTPDERAEAAALASPIDDENLRKLVARAAAASLARAAAGR